VRFTLSICLFSLFTLIALELSAQVKKDSVEKKSLTRKAFKEGMKLISTNPNDTIVNEESINPYEAYAGRIIRNINIEHIGFEKSIYDSAKKVDKTVTKISNFLHVNTREKTVRKHLLYYWYGVSKYWNPSLHQSFGHLYWQQRFIRCIVGYQKKLETKTDFLPP